MLQEISSSLDGYPVLIGVIHLPPLPGSVRYVMNPRSLDDIIAIAVEEAMLLQNCGFQAILIENFNDMPYPKTKSSPETIACMSIIVKEVVTAVDIPVGVSILRNCALDSLSVAHVTRASFIRVNVLSHAYVTDQGIIEGVAKELHEKKMLLGAKSVKILADVDVKHATPLDRRPIQEKAIEIESRSLADVILLTGSRTGQPPSVNIVKEVKNATSIPLLVASGVNESNMVEFFNHCDGFIIGSAMKHGGIAGNQIDPKRASLLASTFKTMRKKI